MSGELPQRAHGQGPNHRDNVFAQTSFLLRAAGKERMKAA